MSQSLANVVIHIVFSTKERERWIVPAIRPRLHAYLGTVVRSAGCGCPRVGGTSDHVHLGVRLSRTIAIADLVETLEVPSSRWMKSALPGGRAFAWQRGYAAFSTDPGGVDVLLAYIDNQEHHHQTRSFQDEYREILRRAGVPFDERYVWE